MPSPSSSTVTTPPIRATRTVPPAGLHLAALSKRLVSARSMAPASPSTYHGSTSISNTTPGARRRTRATAASSTSCSSTVATTCEIGSSRASSTRSPTRVLSSSSCARTSSSSSARAWSGSAGPSSEPAWVSRSMLVRSDVSGVRSSWPASATRRRCRSRDAASDMSIWLKADASRAISSSPSTGNGVRSSVRAIRSTSEVSLRTGRRPLRATAHPAIPAAAMPASPIRKHTSPSAPSVFCCGSSDCAMTSATPSVGVGTAATRYDVPPTTTVRRLRSSRPAATATSASESRSTSPWSRNREAPSSFTKPIRTSPAPSAQDGMS